MASSCKYINIPPSPSILPHRRSLSTPTSFPLLPSLDDHFFVLLPTSLCASRRSAASEYLIYQSTLSRPIVMSTTTFTTVHPPPTFNTLDSFQRARLIRSTRKLGKVLGTTPMLLEPTDTCDLRELLPIGPKSYPGSRSNLPSSSRQKSVMYKQSCRHGSLFNIPWART